MDKYTATEQAFKHGYEKGYEAGQSDVAAECQLCAKATKEVIESLQRKFATENNVGCKWIPVGERLPEKFHTVLVAGKCGDWYSIDLDCIDNSGGWNGDLLRMNDVTHWMPLPEPPKGDV